MAQGKENYAAGEELLAADQNQISKNANDAGGFRDTINAAETISAMRPVFLDDSSNTWKYCDANDTARLRFDGFILDDGSSGNAANVQCAGIVRGFSGLDAGKEYYVQDDGTIGTTPGTYPMLVGVAIDSTCILLAPKPPRNFLIATPSSNLKQSSDSEKTSTGQGAWVILKEIEVQISGFFRIAFDYRSNQTAGTEKARIYVSRIKGTIGTARGAEYTTPANTDWQSTTPEDIYFSKGDIIQLCGYTFGNPSYTVYVRNLRIYFDEIKSNTTRVLTA